MDAIKAGLSIEGMTIGNANNGKILWNSPAKEWNNTFNEEINIYLPKKILSLSAVSREIKFSSKEKIDQFRIIQNLYFNQQIIEEWSFNFGFVIPCSINTWQCTIEAAEKKQMLSANILSGNLIIESSFFDGSNLIAISKCRVFYK